MLSFRRLTRTHKLMLIGTLIVTIVMAAFVWIEITTTRAELLASVESQAETLIETLNRSSETTILAGDEMEKVLIQRLKAASSLVAHLEEHSVLQSGILHEIAEEFDISRILLTDGDGKIISSDAGPSPSYRTPEDLENAVNPILSGEYYWLTLGEQRDPVSGNILYMLAVERNRRPGAVIVGIDTDQLLDFRRRIGIGRLIQDIGDNPGIAFLVLQDTLGILTASKGVTSMSPIRSDTFLEEALSSGNSSHRIIDYEGHKVFEIVKSLHFGEGALVLSRVGLQLDHVRNIRQKSMYRAILIAIGVVMTVAFLLGFVLTRERFAVLSEEHRRVQTYTELVLDNIADGVLAIDANAVLTLFNKTAAGIFGLSRQLSPGNPYEELFPDDIICLGRTLREGVPCDFEEMQYPSPSGSVFYLGVSTSIIRGKEGQVETAIAIVRDLTEQVRAMEQLQRKDKMTAMGELASGIAHEIRNPLNAISVIAQRFQHEFEPVSDQDEYQQLLAVVRSEVQRVNTIISQFLEFSKPPKLNLEPLPVYAVLENCLALVESQARAGNISLEKIIDERGLALLDRERLKQVFINILQNAIEAMDSGGKIKCTVCSRKPGKIHVFISDTGPGIDESIRSKIFNLYFTTKSTGTGLGLSIVHQIISEHGGELSVVSERGGGATFVIVLPAVENNLA